MTQPVLANNKIWSQIRATRHNPPVTARHDSERRLVYTSALQQAEELFTAASVVGKASSPLLTFYGLSQAGRAIAAASRSDDWRLMGHGLNTPDLTTDLPQLEICRIGGPDTSFQRLATILKSPTLPECDEPTKTTFKDLWQGLPENSRRGFPGPNPLPALEFEYLDTEEPHPLVTGVLLGIPPPVTDSSNQRESFDDFMLNYPTASGYEIVRTGADENTPAYRYGDRIGLQIHWSTGKSLANFWERRSRLLQAVTLYDDRYFVLPAIGGNDAPIHPLLTWWAILFALSMLARYQPQHWAQYIDIDNSPYAILLEEILQEALHSVPVEILRVIT